MRYQFDASADALVWGVTLGSLALLGLAAAALVHALLNVPSPLLRIVFALALLFCVAAPLGAYLYAPSEYRITRASLVVERPAGAVEIPLASIRSVERAERAPRALRVWGSGGLFGVYGRFKSEELGPYRMYGRRARDAVILRTDAEPVVVTPDDPSSFIECLRERLMPEGGEHAS